MDAFEQIVETIFRHNGYWTQISYKLNVTKNEKIAIGKPSLPRPEIDILAYKPLTNELLWIECKSYLNSRGVNYESFKPNGKGAELYKIFTDDRYREIASTRLLEQFINEFKPVVRPNLIFCLVAGNVQEKGRENLISHFSNKGWRLYAETWLKEELTKLASSQYENNIVVMVAKLLNKG